MTTMGGGAVVCLGSYSQAWHLTPSDVKNAVWRLYSGVSRSASCGVVALERSMLYVTLPSRSQGRVAKPIASAATRMGPMRRAMALALGGHRTGCGR
jgi:hypothetical protein